MKSSRRHESLIPLSREHHYGLMLCLRIRRGLAARGGDAAWVREQAGRTLAFFTSDLLPHFRAEEEALFPAMRELAGAGGLLEELLAEHRQLAALAARLEGAAIEAVAATLGEFAGLLEAHIRKEERQLFPLFEEGANEALAARVGGAVRRIAGEALRPRDADWLR